MLSDCSGDMQTAVRTFLQHLVHWSQTRPDMLATALVGSQARGQARPDSDVDLVLLVEQPSAYLIDQAWIGTFGNPAQIHRENWGRVTSLRVDYREGLEVEFGLADSSWGSDPGDARVIRDGIIVLYERGHILSKRVKQTINSPSKQEETRNTSSDLLA